MTVKKFLPYLSVAAVPCGKGKVLPYLLPILGPEAVPRVQVVSLQVALSHLPCGRLPLLSARHAVTFPAEEHLRLSASIKL